MHPPINNLLAAQMTYTIWFSSFLYRDDQSIRIYFTLPLRLLLLRSHTRTFGPNSRVHLIGLVCFVSKKAVF